MKNKNEKPSKLELRNQAEATLEKRKKNDPSYPLTVEDALRLVHELEVHKIELEMQNEELMQARTELETTLHQYTDLYDFAPVGYLTLSRDGTISQANLTIAELLGVQRGELIKQRFGAFVSSEFYPTFESFLDKVFDNQQTEVCEVSLLKNGWDTIWVRIEAIFDPARKQSEVCRTAVSDITVRKHVEEKLKFLSIHDALTGLFNRRNFEDALERLEHGRQFPISIVMVDLDDLKMTNDQEGHSAGDALLKRLAQVLTEAFRADDIIARIGGDEFAVLLPNTGAAAAADTLRRLQDVLQRHDAANAATPLRFSVGTSTAETPMRLTEVLRRADEDMYRAKAKKKDSSKRHE